MLTLVFSLFVFTIGGIEVFAKEGGGTPEYPIAKSRKIPMGASPVVGYGQKTEEEIMRERPREPKIGVLAPLSGDLKYFGTEASNGAELASDEIDALGGLNGMEFELLVADTGGRINGARKGIEAFVDMNVLAVIGAATGEVSFGANKAINDNQLIMISAGSRRRLGDTGPYNCRITLDDRQGVASLVGYLEEKKKWKKFALLSSILNDYSIKLSAFFKNELIKRKMEISHELYLSSSTMAYVKKDDFSIGAQVEKLKENTPDALIFTGDGREAVEVIKELRKQGLVIPLVGSEDIMVPEFISLGKQAAGTIVYSGFNSESKKPRIRSFVKAYKKKFGQTPSRLAALSYDAYYLLVESIKRAKSMRPSHLRLALLSIKDFQGVTGKTEMTEDGETIKDAFIFEMLDSGGKYKFVGVKEPN